MEFPDIVILAGGLGTRLKSEVSDLPKTMAPVNGKPFLEYLLNFIESYGFHKVILATGYMSDIIENHFGNRYNNINIEYSIEDQPLGTGGAIKLAALKVSTPHFIALNGDTFFNINLQKLFQDHVENLAKVTIALRHVSDASRYGQVVMDDYGVIRQFREKSKMPQPGLINGGSYILNSKHFRKYELTEKFSFEKDFLEKQVQKGELRGKVFTDYFLDIGIPEDYRKAQTEFRSFGH